MKKYIICGTFDYEVEAEAEEAALAKFDIGDADATILECYEDEEND